MSSPREATEKSPLEKIQGAGPSHLDQFVIGVLVFGAVLILLPVRAYRRVRRAF